jgi:hypothetical protein
MDLLPVEALGWLDHFKARISLESSIVRMLMQWGFNEYAFDIYKKIGEQFNNALESHSYKDSSRCFRLPEKGKAQIREMLRDHYVKTRDIPRRRGCQELLHNGLLTGFEELSTKLVQLYEEYLRHLGQIPSGEKAA